MEIPVILKTAGCTVDIITGKDYWVLQNNYYDNCIKISANKEDYLKELFQFIDKNGNDYAWIIPGDDIILGILNEVVTSEALFHKLMPITKMDNRELLSSKAGFSNTCKKYSIRTPKYMVYDQTMTIAEISNYMGYPFLLKEDKSFGGAGVFLCRHEQDLIENLGKVINKDNLVLQQFIKGYDINTEVLYRNGELIVYSYSRTLVILGKFGISTQRLFYQRPDIEAELIKIGRSIGLSGFGNVVFMYNELDDQHYLIEIDMRPNSWMYYGKYTGNDFSEGVRKIMKDDLTLLRRDNTIYPKEIKIYHYKKDVARCIVEKDVKGFIGWLTNKDKCWQYIPTYDKKLLQACNKYLFWFFKDLFKNKIKKILKGKSENV